MKPVALILDPAFGQDLEQIALAMPAWVISSALNDAAVDATRRKYKDRVDLTSFIPQQVRDKEAAATQALYDIDEHYGTHSFSQPYDELRVFGAADLSERVMAELGWVRAKLRGNALVLRKQTTPRAAAR